jgi:hypothetical protein
MTGTRAPPACVIAERRITLIELADEQVETAPLMGVREGTPRGSRNPDLRCGWNPIPAGRIRRRSSLYTTPGFIRAPAFRLFRKVRHSLPGYCQNCCQILQSREQLVVLAITLRVRAYSLPSSRTRLARIAPLAVISRRLPLEW